MKEKVIISGDIIEILSYSKLNTTTKDMTEVRNGEGVKRFENYAQRQQKRRDMIRRLSTMNFKCKYAKFITLTFKENITDIKVANKEFKKYVQRMRYRYGPFKYIAVIEFQDRGAIHYHMLSDLPYIHYDKLYEIWDNGNIHVRSVDHVDNLGAYLVKYMTKENDDERLQGENGYLISKGLERPIELKSWVHGKDSVCMVVQKYGLDKKMPTYASTYESEFTGNTGYLQFNLSRRNKK